MFLSTVPSTQSVLTECLPGEWSDACWFPMSPGRRPQTWARGPDIFRVKLWPCHVRDRAMCVSGTGRGGPAEGRPEWKWPSLLVAFRWLPSPDHSLLLTDPQDPHLLRLASCPLWNRRLCTGQAHCTPSSGFADWWLRSISHSGGRRTFFIRFSWRCKV